LDRPGRRRWAASLGTVTIELFSVHRVTDCHVQGEAVFSNAS
jgi:hypothetical protein